MNSTPPAAISQTSLPSHTGPIAARTIRRSSSVRDDEPVDDADAEVKAVEDGVDGEHPRDDREPGLP